MQLRYCLCYTVHNFTESMINFIVGETQETYSESFYIILTGFVVNNRVVRIMTIAINFNRQFERGAIEVKRVWPDTKLSPKFVAQNLFAA